MYGVAKAFYVEFMPEVKRVAGPELYDELVKKFLEPHIGHEWYLKGMGKEQLEKMKKFYEERYGGTCAK